MDTVITTLAFLASVAGQAHAADAGMASADTLKTSRFLQTQQLGEVVVKSSLPKIRNNANGMKVIVAGSELEKVGNSKDLLRRLPSIKNVDDGVEVYGRGAAEIYVDGRKLYDNHELERIPSDQILNVEVITTPGARYAATTKAVIRIKTRRKQGEGWGFRDEAKLSYCDGMSARDQLDVNYRQGGLDVSASLMGETQQRGTGGGNYTRMDTYADGKLLQQEIDKIRQTVRSRIFSPGLKINYMFNDNHSIGAQYSYYRMPYQRLNGTLPSVFTFDGQFLQSDFSTLTMSDPYFNHTANMYYSGKFGKWQIDANVDGYWSNTRTKTVTYEDLTVGNAATVHQSNGAYNKNDSRMYTAKLVVERPLFGGNLSFGTEYNDTRRTELNINPAATDGDTKVNEHIWSGFAEYSRMFFNNLRLQAGLRYENVSSSFYEYGKHTMDRDYADWFPSLGLSAQVGKVQLSGNYGIDITRPSFGNLSDNIIYFNSYSYQSGNSRLKPTYTHNITLSASWKWLWGQALYSRVKDDIQMENTSYSDDNKLVTLIHPNNMSAFNRFTFQVFASPTLFSVWHPTWGVVLLLQDYMATDADGSVLKLNRPLANVAWNNIVDLPHKWRVSLDANYQTAGDFSSYRVHRGRLMLSASLQKSFFKNALDLSLKADDITQCQSQPLTIHGTRNLYQHNASPMRVELTAVYKFNVAASKYKGSLGDAKQRQRVK